MLNNSQLSFSKALLLASMLIINSDFLFAQDYLIESKKLIREKDSLASVASRIEERLSAIEQESKILLAAFYKEAVIKDPNTIFAVAEKGPISLNRKVPIYADKKLSETLFYLNPGDSIRILDAFELLYVVNLDSTQGYAEFWHFYETTKLKDFRIAITNQRKNEALKREQENLQKNEAAERRRLANLRAEREQRIRNSYSTVLAERIIDGRVWIGMTQQMALDSKGPPIRRNRTVYSFAVKEQWVYDDMYLYFDNGVLTSFQESF